MTEKQLEFKARIECSLLRGIATSISTLTDEAKFVIDKKKWHIKVVDPARISMLELEIATKNFEEYKCKTPGSIGIDINKLLETIRYTNDRNIVDIIVKDSKITIDEGITVNTFCPVDTNGMSEPKLPNLTLDTMFSMPWADFNPILKRMKSVSDHIKITAFSGGIEFLAENDTDTCSSKIGENILVDYATSKNINKDVQESSLFPRDYLSIIFSHSKVKGCKPFFNHERWLNVVKIRMGQDYPIQIESERNGIKLCYLLAPRVESGG